MTPWTRVVIVASALSLLSASAGPARGQTRWNSGQNVQPVFEGWTANADGSFDMWFGYLNRNYRERPVVPVGADNFLARARPTGASRRTSTTAGSSWSSRCACRPTGATRIWSGP